MKLRLCSIAIMINLSINSNISRGSQWTPSKIHHSSFSEAHNYRLLYIEIQCSLGIVQTGPCFNHLKIKRSFWILHPLE